MNSTEIQKVLSLLLIASGAILAFTVSLGIDDAFQSAHASMYPEDGTSLFRAIVFTELLFVFSRLALGYILLAEIKTPSWLKLLLAFLVLISGSTGTILVFGLAALTIWKWKYEVNET